MIFEKQQYQEDCVSNIIKVLEPLDGHFTNVKALQESLVKIQKEKNIPITTLAQEARLDVLMETGTGKTFTYIKTMYEMNKLYGINKFLIFVPRLAIRSGIIQNIKLTSDYFFQEYGKRLNKYTYEGSLESVNNYLRNKYDFSVLILTSASIALKTTNGNKNSRILVSKRNENTLFPALSPLEAINRIKPVIFIDEPHLLKGDSFLQAYREHFNNSLLLRFGATYPEEKLRLSNVVYSLDSITAFRSHLVKKIRVSSFNDTRSNIRFSRIINSQKAELIYPKENIENKKVIKIGDDIGAITGNKDYSGVYITAITNGVKIHLSNKRSLNIASYVLDKESIRAMVKNTIKKHFEKEEVLFKKGIKTLSLFFIPNIRDFRGDSPTIKKIFEEEYKKIRSDVFNSRLDEKYKIYLEKDFNEEGELQIHNGYFSGDNDSDEKISKAISLILNEKTKLLSMESPLRFIFSVWALQEGWDNPNIFNICKLNSASKEISRRQQIGRGLRLAIDSNGVRQTIKKYNYDENEFYGINMLDMFVSSQEGNFIKEIQNEIINNSFVFGGNRLTVNMLTPPLNMNEAIKLITFLEDGQVIEFSEKHGAYIINKPPIEDFIRENKNDLPLVLANIYEKIIGIFENVTGPLVEDGNRKFEEIKIRQKNLKEFKELWDTITKKAKIVYEDIQEDEPIKAISSLFNRENIKEQNITMAQHIYHHEENTIEETYEELCDKITFFQNKNSYSEFIFNFAKEAKLPMLFVMKLFKRLNTQSIKNNPDKAQRLLIKIVNDEIHRNVIESVGYKFNGDISITPQNVFYDENGNSRSHIKASKIGKYPSNEDPADHYLYEKVRFDSRIEEDASVKSSAAKRGNFGEIIVFAKLPRISIPTPYKHYNPDFAYYIKTTDNKKIFFVAETKGYDSENDIPEGERANIEYARKFFKQLNKETPDDIRVIFKQRINKQHLIELLQDIGEKE